MGLDPSGSLRRRARDRAEPAGDERGRGRGNARRSPRRDQLRPPRARGRLAGRDRARQPDDDRGTATGRRPRASRAAVRVLRRRGLPRARAGRAGSAWVCSRPRQASTESSPPSSSAPSEPSGSAPRRSTLGVLEEREGRLELHPLAAAFLEEQARRETTGDIEPRSLPDAWRRIGGGRSGMQPLTSSTGTGQMSDFETLFADALDELLNAARLATVETWIESRGGEDTLSSSRIEVAKAEMALRDGKAHERCRRSRKQRSRSPAENRANAWRAAMVAGRAAHTGSREESALDFYRLAGAVAQIGARQARCALGATDGRVSLELDEAQDILDVLEATADRVRSLRDRQDGRQEDLGRGTRFGLCRQPRRRHGASPNS